MRRWRLFGLAVLVCALAAAVGVALAATSLLATPSSLDFGSQSVGSTSPAQATVITNTDSNPVTVETVGTDNSDFAVAQEPGDCDPGLTVLAQDEECTVHVTFSPGTAGPRSGTLTVTTDGDDASVGLSGTGTEPTLAADPTSLDFGQQETGDGPTAAQDATVTNTGGEPVTITGETIGGSHDGDFDFASTGNTCTNGTTLDPTDTCTVRVVFDPATTGTGKSAAVSIESNAPTITVDLTGTGTLTELTASPGDLLFGSREIADGAGTEQDETITNSGTETVNFSVDVTGDSADFPGDSTCTGSLDAGESCVLSYAFDPSATGSRSATVTIDSNAPDVSFDLTGTGISTELTADPASLDFGKQDVDDGAAEQDTTITNSGTEGVTISSVSFGGADAGEFSSPGDCDAGTQLDPGDTCTLHLRFNPVTTGAKAATATVNSNAPDVDIDMTGEGTQTELTANPTTIAAGKQDVDDGPAPAGTGSIVQNTGSEPVTIAAVNVTGSDALDFSQSTGAGDCVAGTVLAANDTCNLSFTFDPATTGQKTALATIDSNAADRTVNLTGEGTQTELTRTPASLSFGDQDVDDGPTAAQSSTFTNSGTEDVTISAVNVSGDFDQATGNADDCVPSKLLLAGDTCKLRVRFDPSATGTQLGSATVDSNVPQLTVDLDGEGIQTELTPAPATLPFGDQDVDDGPSAAQTSTIENTGTEPVDVSGVTLGGTNPGQFELLDGQPEDCSSKTTLLAGETCEVRALFDPTTTGVKSAQVSIPGRPEATISLSGEGIQTELTAAPDTLGFGDREIDAGPTAVQTSTVTNTGTEPVAIDDVVLGGTGSAHFTVLDDEATDCDPGVTTLNAGQTCKVRAAFDPLTTGSKTATITVYSDAPDTTITLTGQGTHTEISAAPDSLSFGSKDIDEGPVATQTSTVTNTGTERVDVDDVTFGGADPGQFEQLTGNADDCTPSTSLAANETCKLRLRFDPTSVGAKSASITVDSNAPDESVALDGSGIQTELSRAPGTLAFGDRDVAAGPSAEQTSTVTNSGTEPVTITGVSIGGSQRAQFERRTGATDDCAASTTLAAGETCDVRVRFDPSYEGPKSATVTVASNAATITIALTGTATRATFTRTDEPLTDGYLIDGPVNAVAFDGAGRTYIGGAFSSVGQRTGRGVKLTSSSDQPDPAFADVNGPINAVAADGSGGWYIGGSFSKVGDQPRANLARILPSGAVDASWNPGANDVVNAIAVSGSTVFVGGDFTRLGGQPSARLGRLTGSGGALDTGWTPDPNAAVNALKIADGNLYVGGSFTTLGGQARNRVGRLDAVGDADSWNPGANGTVRAIAADATDVYLGGSFTQVAGQTRNRIAKVSKGGTLDAGWNPNATGGDVLALDVSSAGVYAGGAFTSIGGQSRNRIARLSAATGSADGWNPDANGPVNAIVASGADVYTAGAFTQIGGSARNRIARLSESDGSADGWNPNANGAASALAVAGDDIYVGGAFTSVGGQTARGGIARLLPDGTLDPDWNPGANNTVNALVVDGSDVYVGGAFTSIGGELRNRLAKLTTADGGAADTSWNPNPSSTVNSLALSSGDLYVGGLFTQIGSQTLARTHNRIARVSTAGTGVSDATWTPNAAASVLAIAVSGTDVYIGGNFVKVNDEFHFFLAKLSSTGPGAVDATWKPDANASVRALALADGHLFAGGDFSSIGAQQRNRIAKLSTSGAGLADVGWDANANNVVRALTVAGSDLYAGGDFTLVGGVAHGRIVRLPVTDGGAQDSAWDPAANGSVNALAATGTQLAAGGAFTTVFGQSRQGVALFDLPRLSRDPSGQQFGSRNVGAGPSAVQSSTVTNTSPDTIAFSDVRLGGTDVGDFEWLHDDGGDCTASTTLAPGSSCTVRVRFDPTSTGIKSAWIAIEGSHTAEATIGLAGRGTLTQLDASPTSLALGERDIDDGPTAEQTSVVTNSGSETVTVGAIDIAGSGAADYTQNADEPTDCFEGRPLAAGASCELRIEFDPSVTGASPATVTIASDVAGDLTVGLTGEGTQTLIENDPTSFAFGKQDVDDGPAATQESVVTNTGTETVTLTGVPISGADAGDFSQLTGDADDCANGTVLNAGDTCNVRVQFDPTAVGAKSAAVTITSNAASIGIALSGTGTQTELTRDPASLDYGSQDIDDGPAATQESTVENTGTEDVTVSSVTLSGTGAGDFEQLDDQAGDCTDATVLEAGETCKLRVRFDPAAVGAKSASITVDSNAADVSVDLSGMGIQTTASASPSTLPFGDRDIDDGAGTAQTSTVTNTGTETITIGSVTVAGTDHDDFTQVTGDAGDCAAAQQLDGGESCEVRVEFDPATVGSKSAHVTVTASGVPDMTVALTGRGTQTLLTRDPGTLAFGGQDIDVGPTAIKESTVTNSGTESVSISSVDVTGEFDQVDDASTDCTSSTVLTAGETCKVRVRFDPDTTGAKTGTVTVSSNAAAITVDLTGTGTQTEISGSPGTLAFGAQDIDDGATAAQTGTVTNTGTEDVTLGNVGLVGTDSGQFGQPDAGTDDCQIGTVLHQNDTCDVRVFFDPSTTGSKTATARVSANGVDVDFALTGTGTQTLLTRDPGSLSFGSQDIDDGATAAEESTITNDGTETVTLTGVDVTGDFAQVTPDRGDCDTGTVLNAGQTCKVRVTFDPTSTGTKSGTVTVSSNAADVSVSLSGTGIQTLLTRDPGALSFGNQDIDDGATAAQESTVTNSGTQTVTLTNIAVTGDFAQAAFETGDCTETTVLGSGQTCKLRVEFDPTSTGSKSGTVTVASNAADVTVSLDGTGTQTLLTRSPVSLSFGPKDIDDGPTSAQESTVTNSGSETVTLTGVSVTGDFAQVTPGAGDCDTATVLIAGATCKVRVTFDPTSTGSKSGTVTVASNAADVTVSLDGTGTQTLLTRAPASLSFGPKDIDDGPTSAQESTVTNSGSETVTLTGVDVSGDFAQVTPATGDCDAGTVLGAGATCKVRVTFDPTSTGGKNGTATVKSNAADVTVSLDGTGTQTLLTRDPASLSFGSKDIDDGAASPQESTVTNSGSETVTLTGVGVSGDFAQVTPTTGDCQTGTALGAGATCKLRVTFDPTATGTRTGAVTVESNAATVTVGLSGEGIQTSASVSPTSLAFGNQDVDDGPTATQTATVTNTGSQDVHLTGVSEPGSGFERLTDGDDDCKSTTVLTAGQTCTVRVRFDPAATGNASATITITSGDVAGLSVSLTGKGVQTQLSRAPASLSFGDKDIDDGATSAMTSTITNAGSETVTLTGVNVTGDFAQATVGAGDCDTGTALDGGESCTVRITFNPSSTGARSGTATVHSNSADVSVALDGEGIQTTASVAPASLAFGKQDIDDGATATQTSTITNTGTEDVDLSAVNLPAGDFALVGDDADDCTASTTLAAGETCTIRVRFDPTTTGSKSATVTVKSGDVPDLTVSLTGTGSQTQLSRGPASLAFGKQDIDDGPTASQTSTVTNSGSETVTLTDLTVTGDFSQSTGNADDCVDGDALAAGATCELRLRFDPASTGAKTGTATVKSDTAAEVKVDLTGTGTQTLLTRTPATYDFGDQDVDDGPTPPAKVTTVTNDGSEPVTLVSVTTTSDFAHVTGQATDCIANRTLAAGATCAIRERFDPTSTGAKSGTVTVDSNAADVTVALSGKGVQTLLDAAPASLALGARDVDDGPSAAAESTVTNTGSQPVTLTSVATTGDFAHATGNGTDCVADRVLAAGATCKLRVTFDPSDTGARAGTATIRSNSADIVLALSGTGTQTRLAQDLGSLALGSQDVDDGPTSVQQATVANTGTEPVTLTGVDVTGDFAQATGDAPDCVAGKTLAANEGCSLRVRFDPSSTGAKSGAATVHSNAADISVGLSGTGIQTDLSRTPTALNFGTISVSGGATPAQESTFTNNGTEPVSIAMASIGGPAEDQFSVFIGQASDCSSSPTLAPGATCKVRVLFDPTTAGAKVAAVTVASSAGPDLQVNLAGTATPVLGISAIKAKAASTKRKRLKVPVTSLGGPVKGVVVTIFKGKKRVGSGKVASVSGKKKVVVKLRKPLKRGAYVAQARGNDGIGNAITAPKRKFRLR